MNEKTNISWYAKHMEKSVQEIISKKNNFDFIIEVLDSRAPITTHNEELVNHFKDKVFIKIALKKDLSSWESQYFNNILLVSTKCTNDRKKIINQINNALTAKKENLVNKGLVNPTFYGVVLGIPNTGKSSLINFLSSKKIVITENKPGITRKVTNIKISNNLFLADTPGIFFKKIDDYETGIKLALLNSINTNLFSYKDIAEYCFQKIIIKSSTLRLKFFVESGTDFETFINYFCKKQNYVLKNNNLDLDRGYKNIINTVSSCKFKKIFLDY